MIQTRRDPARGAAGSLGRRAAPAGPIDQWLDLVVPRQRLRAELCPNARVRNIAGRDWVGWRRRRTS